MKRIQELENNTDETLWVEIYGRGVKIILCAAYKPPSTDTEIFLTRLNHAIGLSYQLGDNLVVTGDLNCDLLETNNKLQVPYYIQADKSHR